MDGHFVSKEMFCSHCGSALISEAKFCHLCGSANEVVNEDLIGIIKQEKRPPSCTATGTATVQSTLPFAKYRQQKEKETSSRFQPKAKKAKTENNADKKPTEVSMQIGLIKLRDDDLKVVRGSTLPLKVYPSIGADDLRKKAHEKIKFNQDLVCGTNGYSLLYPDRTEVMNLPGSGERFTLKRYKEELGKAYGRITLYLCKSADVLCSLQHYYSSDSDNIYKLHIIQKLINNS